MSDTQTTSPLLDAIVARLAPLFLETAGNDPALARQAARETIAGCQANSAADLLLAAQSIAFGLAALATLAQAMAPDLPPETALRLRARANTLSRTADRTSRRLERTRHAPPPLPPPPHDTLDETKLLADIAALAEAPQAPPVTAADQDRARWAAAFADVAQEVAASLPNLPPAERRVATIQASALNKAARSLRAVAPFAIPAHAHPRDSASRH